MYHTTAFPSSEGAVTLRTELKPGDVGTIIYLHGTIYAHEYGFDPTFRPMWPPHSHSSYGPLRLVNGSGSRSRIAGLSAVSPSLVCPRK